MDCRETLENSSAFIDDELAPEAAASFREHIGSCPSCAAEFQAMEEASGAVAGSLKSIDLRSEVWLGIQSRIAALHAPGRKAAFWTRLFEPKLRLAAAVSLALLALVSGTITVVLHRRAEADLQVYMERYIQSRHAAAESDSLEEPRWWRSPYSAVRSGGNPENPFLDVDYSRPIVNPFEPEGK